MQSLSIKGTKAYCFYPHFNKPMLMGTVIGDTLFKSVNDRHFMRTVGGYGFQYDAFACLEQNGIKKIEILEQHTGVTWMSKPSEWLEHGKIADYGRGKQIFLSLKYMARKHTEHIEEMRHEKEMKRASIRPL